MKARTLNEYGKLCHEENAKWWYNEQTGEKLNRNKGEMISLMHSELSECLEGERKHLMDKHLPHRPNPEVELADLLIRVFDYAYAHGYDLDGAFYEKMEYNRTRIDHKKESKEIQKGNTL